MYHNVKCAFGFRSFNDLKTKCVPLSVELGSEQGGHVPPVPPYVADPAIYSTLDILYRLYNVYCTIVPTQVDGGVV